MQMVDQFCLQINSDPMKVELVTNLKRQATKILAIPLN